ncbi:hypothetical protein D9M68_921610 [compost metagenome]
MAFHQGAGQQLAGAVDVTGGQWNSAGRSALGEAAVLDEKVFGRAAEGADVAQPVGVGHGDLVCSLSKKWGPLRGPSRMNSLPQKFGAVP